MTWVLVGLGNPDEEYARTRHNAGRMALQHIAEAKKFGEWKDDAKSRSEIVRGAIGKSLVVCILPNTYMNKSGSAVVKFVKSVKAAEKLVVVYDDLDLPFGTLKISFDRGSGGHKGIESIERALKTRRFVRIRVGISKKSGKGEVEKPHGEKNVEKFILGEFSVQEIAAFKEIFKRVATAIDLIVTDGREKATNVINSA